MRSTTCGSQVHTQVWQVAIGEYASVHSNHAGGYLPLSDVPLDMVPLKTMRSYQEQCTSACKHLLEIIQLYIYMKILLLPKFSTIRKPCGKHSFVHFIYVLIGGG